METETVYTKAYFSLFKKAKIKWRIMQMTFEPQCNVTPSEMPQAFLFELNTPRISSAYLLCSLDSGEDGLAKRVRVALQIDRVDRLLL